ncbi:Zn-dependent hydrolase [Pseudomonas sp. DNDY-54]|uniref:Zn-dependent hydrolase n=1 Tax=Pseudomonas sp. DNDY-54 TaxID=2870860 RepID=UPI001CA43D1C|nr:Zn-dependent hydrolase [Pseudomonas sp. DNDY-54]
MRSSRMVGLLLMLLAASVDAAALRFSLVRTSQTLSSGEYAWRDGGWVQPPPINHIAVLIEHQGSRLLFGTGLGREIDAQLDSELPWRRKRYGAVRPVRDQLDRDDLAVDRIVMGCARWQYASGLADFADVPVLASQEAIRYAHDATPPAVIPAQFAHGVKWQPLRFQRRPYGGFKESLDLFGDERLVLVKLPGHGALGLFLTLEDGRRVFFRGDAADGETSQKPLSAEVLHLHDARLQSQLGFYPRWIQ